MNCTISVTFTLSAGGIRSATVSIQDNVPGTPQQVTLSGTGVAPSITLAPASLTFASQNTNTTSPAQTVTLTNNGPGALIITSIALTGANPTDFAQSNNCLVPSIPANSSCSINVTFAPAFGGARSASLSITDNATGNPQTLAISGTGVGSLSFPWPNGYTYQATFTVTAGKVPSAQANFPALISGSFPDLRTTANGGRVANTCTQAIGNNSLSVPCDLIFTSDAAGSSLLNWEFESYNPATGAVNIWVRFSSISSGSSLYAWYGNSAVTTLQTSPSATWNPNFLAVYHLKEDPSGAAPQVNDSSPNANHGTTNGAMPAALQTPGEISGSLSFNGGSYFATLANPASFSFERTDTWSASLWVKPVANISNGLLTKQLVPTGWNFFQRSGSANPTFALELASSISGSRIAVNTSTEWPLGIWRHVVVTYNGSSTAAGVKIYVDGVLRGLNTIADALGTNSILTSAAPQINGRGGATFLGSQTEDEVRVYTKGVVLSPDWITSEFNNQSSPASFFTVVSGLTNSPSSPVVTFSPASLTFANQNTNTTSPAQTVTLTNNGPGALTITGIALTGANPTDFAQASNCLVPSIPANSSCSINVTFTPTFGGSRAASLSIADNASNSPQTLAISGTGVTPLPLVTLAPTSLAFASQNTNTTSPAQTVTLTNNGPGALTITGIALTGANPTDFAQASNCLVPSIPANSSCSINVTFTPTAAGSRSAFLSIADNASNSPQTLAISGTGVGSLSFPWPNGYTYQATFTVASGKVPSAQADFPALISGSFPDLRTTANGGRVTNTCTQAIGNNSLSVPCDLIFTSDAAGSSLLNWEFESYNPATGAVNIWVRFSSISSGSSLYAWYGNSAVTTLQTSPSATWNPNFLAVYHLKEDPSGPSPQVNDSTANAFHCFSNGAMPASQQTPGVISGSLNFNGGSYFLSCPNSPALSFERTDSWSVSAWSKPSFNSSGTIFSKEQDTSIGLQGWELYWRVGGSNPTLGFELANSISNRFATRTSNEFSAGNFHHVVATYNGNSLASGASLYVDGLNQAKSNITDALGANSILTSTPPEVSARGGSFSRSPGTHDEIRIYAKGVVLPQSWITTEFNNQNDPASFFSIAIGLTKP